MGGSGGDGFSRDSYRPRREDPTVGIPPAERPSTGGDSRELAPRKRRGGGILFIAVVVIGLVAGAIFFAFRSGVDVGVRQERAAVAASASILAANKGPDDMQCPNANSDVAAANAITSQPTVVITDPPTKRILVMRKAVVVIVQATIAGDLIVCGNDAVVVLEKPLSTVSGRLNIVGGTDAKPPAGKGPILYLVDDVAAPAPDKFWFSNGHPRIIRCYRDTPSGTDRPRACGEYFKSAPATPSPSTSPSRK